MRSFRRLCLLLVGGIRKRHKALYTDWPWRLLVLADNRISVEERAQVATSFVRCSSCCLPEGIARQLHNKLRMKGRLTAQFLLKDREILFFIYSVARLTSFTIADVEWRHGRQRSQCHADGQTTWCIFVAASVNKEAKTLHNRMVREVQKLKTRRCSGCQGRHHYLRAQTSLQLFRIDMIERDKKLHKSRRGKWAVTKAYWTQCKKEFAALPADRHDDNYYSCRNIVIKFNMNES